MVLRQQPAVLRRQVARPRFDSSDPSTRCLPGGVVPLERWRAFLVTLETVLHWHRALVWRHWTYPRRGAGRPPLPHETVELVVRLARENPTLGSPAHRRRTPEARRHGLQGQCRQRPPPPPTPARAAARRTLVDRVPPRPGQGHRRHRLLHRRHRAAAALPRAVRDRSRTARRAPARGHGQAERAVGNPGRS